MTPLALTVWSGAVVTVAVVARRIGPLAAFLSLLLVYGSVRMRQVRPARNALVWSLPFAVPLLLIHTFVNRAFIPTLDLWGIPVRLEGLQYAVLVTLRIALLTAVAACWREMDPERIVHSAVGWRLPLSLVVMTAMACSSVTGIVRRVSIVREAQQARGLRVRGGLLVRARALGALVIPVVVGSIVDSESRAAVLHTRGLGSGPLAVPPAEPFTARDALDIAACAAGVGVSLVLL